ncbi:hypothetical protein MHU86_5386 [Fragilaria crotonensis]|nr:hypothetical protein MHU86_5386 [Fragilaria crotonensis]
MVEKQRPRSGSKFSLKPQIAAALSALPPLGYKAPPPLIGGKTTSSDTLALRARNYTKAYKTLSVKDWNSYVVFGIQQFASPSKYLATRDSESTLEYNLRLGRYYRLHLEHKAPVDKFLMAQIVGIEAALQTTFPGYFDMSVVEMDEYLRNLSPEDRQVNDEELLPFSPPTKLDTSSQQDVEMTSEASCAGAIKEAPLTEHSKADPSPSTATGILSPTTQEFQDIVKSIPLLEPGLPSATIPRIRTKKGQHSVTPSAQATDTDHKGPSKVNAPVRIEARWAPKDFHALKASTAQMYSRLAPLLSTFNTQHSWMIEWQTDQLAPDQTISPTQLSKFLSIRVVPVTAQQCFYFSFRVNATGKQLIQVLQSKEQKKAKRGENMTFDPSYILAHHGEPVFIGDILLKDASVTQRTHYLKYLRTEVLSAAVPAFDIKMRQHKDPAGKKTPILTVRCGRSVAVEVAQALSTALNGTGSNPEIFISRLALGANQIKKGEHEKIYKVHHEYLSDIMFIPFPASRQIDLQVIEHLNSGETVTRSPRQWAKSLCDKDGIPLEVDLENGTIDGSAVLITPSASHHQTILELQQYWQRQNPALAHATKMYQDTVLADPDIPMTVFTKNIDTILAKKIKKRTPSERSDDAATFLSPESSITGATSKSPKGPIAWKKPLQETIQRHEYHKASRKMNSGNLREIQQQQRIDHLEAKLASMSTTNSKASSTTEQQSKMSQSRASNTLSHLSGNSPTHTIASAHARLDGIETAVLSIQNMLTTLTAGNKQEAPSSTTSPPSPTLEWPSIIADKPTGEVMGGIQLFPATGGESNTVALSLLSTPTKNNRPKRRKPTASPDLRLQYNDSMGSSGEGSF